MGEGAWTTPPVVADARTFEFTFVNDGEEEHQPVVVSSTLGGAELMGEIEERGLERFLTSLVSDDHSFGQLDAVVPDAESGQIGHFHPGGPDAVDLPTSALVGISDGGETIHYVFTTGVPPGGQRSESSTCCEPGMTFGERGGSTTFVVVCVNADHADRGEYALFEVSP